MGIEHARKHGPFDPRYPPIRHKSAMASLWRFGEARTDSRGFLARFFPDSSRHDSDALAAYESYINNGEGCPRGSPARASPFGVLDGAASDMTHSEAEEEPLATADSERWEGEGGRLGKAPAANTKG